MTNKPPRELEEWRVEGIITRANGDISFFYTWSNVNGASSDPRNDALNYVSSNKWVRPPRIANRRIVVYGWEEFDAATS